MGYSKYNIGKDHHNWKGDKSIRNGYVFVWIGNGKYKQEHIIVMEKFLGRKLIKNEIVHHIDESFIGRSNNNIDNLQLTNRIDHNKHHFKWKGKGYSVYFDKRYNKWRLVIQNKINGRYYYYNKYETKEKALEVGEQKSKDKRK